MGCTSMKVIEPDESNSDNSFSQKPNTENLIKVIFSFRHKNKQEIFCLRDELIESLINRYCQKNN